MSGTRNAARRSIPPRLALAALTVFAAMAAPDARAGDALPEDLTPFFQPPAEYAGDFGDYRPPLLFYGGRRVETAEDWRARRAEIRAEWMRRMGEWPPLLDNPEMTFLDSETAETIERTKVTVQIAPDGRTIDGYWLVPKNRGEAPLPAAVVVYYDPETGAGMGRELRDFGFQLAKRGIAALSIGMGASLYYPDKDNAKLQPLSALAYAASNARAAIANLPYIDAERIGITGHSYGGKWAMFASCLDEKFACAAWSDGGIVFDESRPNVNYWEPWYLGYEKGFTREPGVPSEDNPRTGAYKDMVADGFDLHELHALMAPRPFLVSGGSEDPPERWRALNHAVAVNRLLGRENRVAMTNREGHAPTFESNEQLYRFFEHFLAPAKP